MKFRRLNSEELAEVEKEFINFLASNTITGEDWVKIKSETPEKADDLIDLFSDIVFEKVLKKVSFLEFKAAKDIKIFQCLEDKIKLMGLQIKGESELDFRQITTPEQMVTMLQQSDAKLQLYQAEKSYNQERELELFDMMENGCLITKGELFKVLEEMK